MPRPDSGDFQPLKFVFYDDLDTVRFNNIGDEERKARAITTTASVMSGMLNGGTGTVLSLGQSYDNQLLLTLLSAEGERADRDDKIGFLRLVRRGFIQVGLLENGPAADPPDGERYTIMNMLRTSLANPAFVLSGWPDLNDNPDLRREVLGCLNRDLGERMSAGVPAGVAARIEGLRHFDQLLRESPRGIKVVRQAEVPLEIRLRNMLQITEADRDSALRAAAASVIERAQRDGINLNTRSDWYRLIDLHSQYPVPADSGLRALRDMVDLNYNAMLNESLGTDGSSLSASFDNVADTAAREFTPGQSPGKRWADLDLTYGKGSGLRWSAMPQLLDELQDLSPQMRLRELERREVEQRVKLAEVHSWGASMKGCPSVCRWCHHNQPQRHSPGRCFSRPGSGRRRSLRNRYADSRYAGHESVQGEKRCQVGTAIDLAKRAKRHPHRRSRLDGADAGTSVTSKRPREAHRR